MENLKYTNVKLALLQVTKKRAVGQAEQDPNLPRLMFNVLGRVLAM